MSQTTEDVSSVSSVAESTEDSGEVTILPHPTEIKETSQPTSDEGRSRKFTEKGLEWQIGINSKKSKSFFDALHALVSKTESFLLSSKDVEALKAHLHALQSNLKVTSDTCDRLRGLLILAEEEEQVNILNQDFELVALSTRTMVSKVERRIHEIENEEFETATNYSQKTHSSRRSKTSNSSRRSEAAAEAAALRAKLKYIDLEAKTKAELEKLQTMKQIDMAEAKIGAFEVYDEEKIFSLKDIDNKLPKSNPKDMVGKYIESCVTHQPEIGIKTEGLMDQSASVLPALAGSSNDAPPAVENIPVSVHLNPNSPEFSPKQAVPELEIAHGEDTLINSQLVMSPKVKADNSPLHNDSGQPMQSSGMSVVQSNNADQSILDLAKVLADQVSISRLPPPEPSIFNGDPLKYPGWKSAFQTLIEHRTIPANEKMHYLKKYLGGQVREVVEQYFLLTSDDAYEEAKLLLDERYGNPFVIANAYCEKLDKWPKINARDGAGLQKFADFLRQCHTAAESIGHLNILNDEMQNRRLLIKLPDWLVTRWGRIVASHKEEKKNFPQFKIFVDFIVKEAKIACDPVTSLQCLKGDRDQSGDSSHLHRAQKTERSRPTSGRSFFTETNVKEKNSPPQKPQITCNHCGKFGHDIDECRSFLARPLEKRKEFAKEKDLCFGCLCTGHQSKKCKQRKRCKHCEKMHPSSLHGDTQRPKIEKAEETEKKVTAATSAKQTGSVASGSSTTLMNAVGNSDKSSMVVPVFVSHVERPDKERLVYALLDTQSDTTFILENTCKSLGLNGTKVKLRLSTMHAENRVVDSSKVQGLMVRGYNSSTKLSLPAAFTRNIMPANRDHIPTPEMARKWPHLYDIAEELMPLNECEVGLLIGYNCACALTPRQVIAPIDDGPFGQRTDLGWGIVGVVEPDFTNQDSDLIGVSHRAIACQVPQGLATNEPHSNKVWMSYQTRVKELITPSDVANMMELDFCEYRDAKVPLSHDERQFVTTLQKEIRLDGGHYSMPLPFSQKRPCLPNNKMVALQRLKQLRKRLDNDKKYRQHYVAFMNDIIQKGHAERVPDSDLGVDDGSVWYIPHHGVYHPQKKDKIRVVFDCSARFQNIALNDHLLQGPDLTNTLIGVLCRFRKEPVAFMCDIEQMFHQFRVNTEDRNYLRFLWWQDEDYSKDPIEMRMCVHLFGAASSPGCANFGLKQVASDNEANFGSSVADFLRRDFYVDDGLKSLATEAEAIHMIHETKKMCNKGGLHLHKFISNSKAVLEHIPSEDRAKGLKDIDLLHDSLPVERALGIQWCVESDTFQFRLVLRDRPLTRRGILSTINSVYDPLGFLAPVLLVGKQILQCMCREQADWDAPLPEELKQQWQQWKNGLFDLERLQIQRCSKPVDFGEVVTAELHHFSDASTNGYGQCTYLRLLNKDSRVHVSLIIGKSRVAPLKHITIPRLELVAALVSVKISSLLNKELEYENITEYYWTDSKIVLAYIANNARRFHDFVANRVQQIRDYTDPSQWRYVCTSENPADLASRGMPVSELQRSMWFTGPEFLWKQELPSVDKDVVTALSPDDCEIKKVHVFDTHAHENYTNVCDYMKYLSSWSRVKRVIALCSKFIQKLKQRIAGKNVVSKYATRQSRTTSPVLTVEELVQAEQNIVKAVQMQAFGKEISTLPGLKGNKHVRATLPRQSTIYKLDPFLDDEGILRVGGRMNRALMGSNVKHPMILPKKCHVSDLVIRHYHEKVGHQGRGMTINEIRANGFWIIGLSSAVSGLISRCVICRRLRSVTQVQKMAELPEDRVEPSPPFTYSGVDYFGPWYIREGRKELKRYGVVFTCLCCRAIHLETAVSLTTDSFINALRRFIAIRGPVRELRCDRGTNFIGAERELREAVGELDENQLRQFLLKENCDYVAFKTNVPHASHMGGIWERQIRTVRSILATLLSQHGSQLNDESLRTLLCETAAIVNSRPLSVQNANDPLSLEPLTPNNLLTMKSKLILPPPGKFQATDMYSRKRWRRIQYLANQFWFRWQKEYLQTLQVRNKWLRAKRNLSVGDIVLAKEENLPRNEWHLGKVTEAPEDKDGLVRKASVVIGSSDLNGKGQRTQSLSSLERPIHKLVLIQEASI